MEIKKAPEKEARIRGVPRQWFTEAIIMKKYMCNDNITTSFVRSFELNTSYQSLMNIT